MQYDPDYDMYYQEVGDGWEYYNSDGSYAGFEGFDGSWFPADGYEDQGEYNGNGNGGSGGEAPIYEPYIGAPGVTDWLEVGEHIGDEGISVAEIGEKAESDPWYKGVLDILKSVGKGALEFLGNVKISGTGGSGAAGGGPTVTIPGIGTYGTSGRIKEPIETVAEYLPYILIGGVAYLLFIRKK